MQELLVAERLKEAEARSLLRQAGIVRRTWITLLSHRLLNWLGRALVSLGQRLQDAEAVPAPLQTRQVLGYD
jgi:hypothetical protein